MAEHDEEQQELALDPINAKIQELGPEFALGMDIQRHFVNGAQTFAAPDYTIIVFREQNLALNQKGTQKAIIANRTSVMLPTAVALQLRDQLNEVLGDLNPSTGHRQVDAE